MGKYNDKIDRIMYDDEFKLLMKTQDFVLDEHKALIVFLFLTGVRISEALAMRRKQFKRTANKLYIDIGVRLKGSKLTPALPVSLKAPYVQNIILKYENLGPTDLVFPYSRKTGYNIGKRFIGYPHYFRMNRITRFFLDGFTIPEVQSWTGLSIVALNYYIGKANIEKMGESLGGGMILT